MLQAHAQVGKGSGFALQQNVEVPIHRLARPEDAGDGGFDVLGKPNDVLFAAKKIPLHLTMEAGAFLGSCKDSPIVVGVSFRDFIVGFQRIPVIAGHPPLTLPPHVIREVVEEVGNGCVLGIDEGHGGPAHVLRVHPETFDQNRVAARQVIPQHPVEEETIGGWHHKCYFPPFESWAANRSMGCVGCACA